MHTPNFGNNSSGVTRRVACFAFLPLLDVHGQPDSDRRETSGLTNGRLWLTLSSDMKLSFLAGSRDAMIFAAVLVNADRAKSPDELKLPDLTVGEIAKEMDLFYSEGANGPVPIVAAIRYITHKARGDTPAQLQELMASLRRAYQ